MTKDEREIRRAVRRFAADMLDQMVSKMEYGRHGWSNPDDLYWKQHGGFEAILCSRIKRHNAQKHRGNEVDDANHLMMLWVMRGKEQP